MLALAKARSIYDKAHLLGSSEKDVVAETTFKAAGAEVRSDPKNVRLALSLRVARLPAVTPGLVARLAGNWVSVLQYRKCLSSLIDDLFLLSSQCSDSDFGVAVPLPRRISQELVLLSSMAPLMCSNLSVNFLDRLFATDASCQKGGIVSAEIPLDVH